MFQSPGQKYQDFIDKWEALEAEIPFQPPEELRVATILAKLEPSLAQQILLGGMPKTVARLHGAAKTAEAIQGQRVAHQEATPPQPRPNYSARYTTKRRKSQSPPTSPRGSDTSTAGAKGKDSQKAQQEADGGDSNPTDHQETPSYQPYARKQRRRDPDNVTCFVCDKQGHYATTCPEKPSNQQQKETNNTPLGTRQEGPRDPQTVASST